MLRKSSSSPNGFVRNGNERERDGGGGGGGSGVTSSRDELENELAGSKVHIESKTQLC